MICDLIYKLNQEGVTALAGRPDAGITTLAVSMAKYLVFQEQQGVIFFSPQFEKADLISRYMPDTPDALEIDDTPGITVEEIRRKCLAYMQQEKIRWIFIDRMLLMRSSNDFNSRIDELVEIVYGLNVLAKELHLSIIVLTPLKHGTTNRSGLHDFKEIGFELEKMVNFVLFLRQENQEQEITLIKPDAALEEHVLYRYKDCMNDGSGDAFPYRSLKHFKKYAPLRPYRKILGDVELCYLKHMPEDKLYILCDQPDAEYGFKEMIACISDEKLMESYGFTEDETAEIIAEAAKYKGRMAWFAKNAWKEKDVAQQDGNVMEKLQEKFIETFIPSIDEAAYLKAINYAFNDLEKAVIIANHELLNPEEKIILLNALIDLTTEEQLKARIKESVTEWQGRLEDWEWYQTASMALYDKIFIPHDFGHGDIVYIRGAWNKNELGFISGYDEACYDFDKNSEGDYSDVQICVETIFAADGKSRAEFSHQHVNPIYIERAVLCHDDSRKAYMEQILSKSKCEGRQTTEKV